MRALATQEDQSQSQKQNQGQVMRHALKPKTPSGAARFNYINRSGKYERDKADLVFAADHNMPDFAKQDALIFWENADEHERSDARVCLELELNLPSELKTVEQQIAVVEIYIKQLNEKAGRFPISYAIHSDKDGQNPHVHLMLSERALDGIERPAEQYFRRGNSKNPSRGGAIKSRWWHDKKNVFWSRAAWAESCNQVLIANGFDPRFDPRTKLAQRAEAIEQGDLVRAVQLSTLTETHEGPHVGGIRKRLAAGQYQRSEVDAGILQKIDSNDTIKTFNRELELFAVTAPEAQLRAFLACETAADRVEFIAKIYTSKPTPTEPENYGFHESQQSFEPVSAHGGGLQQHLDHLFVVQARQNNLLLQQALSRSEPSEICGGVRNLSNARGFVRPAIQSLDTEPSGGLRDVRRAERVLSHTELNELYKQAERAASDAELQADFAGCRVDELRANARQLLSEIDAARPTVLQRVLIKIGLSVDQSIELKRRARPLLDSIRQAEIELKQQLERARDLRIYADDLKIRANFIEKPRPSGESVGYDFHLLKQQLEQQRSVTESHGAAPAPAPAPASTQLDRKPRGPRL